MRLDKKQDNNKVIDYSSLTDLLTQYFLDKPVDKVWLFGSILSSNFRSDSDIDILIQLSKNHQLDLFDYLEMNDEISDLTSRSVDLVVDGQLDELISERVNSQKELIYEKR